MRIVILGLLCLMPMVTSANYVADRKITAFYGSDTIFVGVDGPPSDTCSYWEYQFKFDATTEGGKNMLAILLTAQASGKTVQLWYSPSPSPGTDQTSGCDQSKVAILTELGIRP